MVSVCINNRRIYGDKRLGSVICVDDDIYSDKIVALLNRKNNRL